MKPDVEKKMKLYQQLTSSLQTIMMQMRAYMAELAEIEKALEELEKYSGERVFRSIGPAMIEVSKDEVVSELREAKEDMGLKLESLKKQEEMVSKRLEKLKKEIEEMSD